MIITSFKPQLLRKITIHGLFTATVSAVRTGVCGALLAAASAPRPIASSSGLTALLKALSHRHAQRIQSCCGDPLYVGIT